MLDLLLFLVTAWAATAAGRAALQGLRLSDGPTRLERNLFGLALGLGGLAYGMLLLGLAGGLYRPAGFGLLLLLLALGSRQHPLMARELQDAFKGGIHLSPWGWAAVLVFALLAFIPMVGVWTPPTAALEWDSLSYHLADPKMYLQAHRFLYLPWESHSNFAFTAEMWYLYGLMEGGVPLAKCFHFICGVGTCLALYAFGARHLSPRVGLAAVGIFASTPLVLWEAGTAYADLAGAFFGTLTLLAVAHGIAGRDGRWLRLGAVLMGLTLSTKATALSALALLALALLVWQVRQQKSAWPRALGKTAAWCALALVVGSPWYVKSAIYTGNPVYPFYFQIFGGRGFSADLIRIYDASNANFGVSYQKPTKEDPATDTRLVRSPDMAALAPWNLTMYLLPGNERPNPAFRAYSDTLIPLILLSPLLLAALFFPAFSRGAPNVVKALGLYALLSGLLWIATSQQVRYLLLWLPVLCLLAAWVLVRALEVRARSGHALVALGVASVAFALYTSYSPTGAIGGGLVAREAPVVFGMQSRADYLDRDISGYPVMRFINTQLPASAKIVFYGHPLGFYCDRPYFWGDAQHSTFIPYDAFHDENDLRAYLQKIGVTHILVDHRYFTPAPGYTQWVDALTAQSGPSLFESHGVAVYALPGAKP